MAGRKLSLGNILIIVILCVATFVVVWKIGSKQPESSTNVDIPTLAIVDVEVNVNQASLVGMDSSSLAFNPGDVYLFIPSNELTNFGQISFIPKEANLLVEAGDPGWERPIVYNIEFKDSFGEIIEVEINGFIEVCFVMDDSLWVDYLARPEKYEIQFYDESLSPIRWVPLKMNVYNARKQICGETSHFSLFSLAFEKPATPTPRPSATNDSTATETVLETETPSGVYEP